MVLFCGNCWSMQKIKQAITANHAENSALITTPFSNITKCSTDTALRDIQALIAKNILAKEEALVIQ